MMNNNNPWAGLASYEDPSKSERKLKFCGRDNDIYDVTRLIDDNLLLVLYGKSGIGKTSLLNAGVFPKLRLEQYLPVSIRLGILETNVSYQEAIISAVEKAIEEVHGSITVFNVVEKQTDDQQSDCLWNYFARHRFFDAEQQPLFPVVVFDQFEEVLRNSSSKHIGAAQILLNQLQYLINESHALSDCIVNGKEYFYDFNFRFVISIREDELYLLEDNIDDLSLSMFRNCRYRLRSLSEQGAKEAILVPGKDCIVDEEKQAVVDRVIELSKRPQSNDIDTLLLSLVCSGTFDKKVGKKISLSDLDIWKSNPMEVYYQDAIKGLSANQVRYIQQHLIREDGSRKRVNAQEVKTALGENIYNILTRGENRMLVIGEHNQVELLHDQLAMAVYEERKAFEEKERKKRMRRRMTIIGALVFSIAGVFLFQNHRLKQQRWKMMENQARFVAEKANNLIDEGYSYLAQRLLLDVLPDNVNHPDKPCTAEAEFSLRKAVSQNNAMLTGHNEGVNFVAFSPDGKRIVSASDDKTIRIWNAENGLALNTLEGHTGPVYSANFNPDGKRIASASKDSTIRIWDAESGAIINVLKGHTNTVNSVAFGPDGKRIVSAADDKTIRIWDASTGKELSILEGHSGSVFSASFSPDGIYIVSASFDGTIRIWNAETGKEIKKIINDYFANDSESLINHDYFTYATFSPDGKSILSVSNYSVYNILDVETGKDLDVKNPVRWSNPIRSAIYSPDGKSIVSATTDNTIVVLDAETGRRMKRLSGHNDKVNFAAFSPDGKHVVSASDDNTIRIWDINRSLELKILEGHSSGVLSTAFSPNGNRIASSSFDETIHIRDAETGIVLDTLIGHTKRVISVSFSPDGNRIASASYDNTIRIWDTETGLVLDTLKGHARAINSISFDPDGKYIVSASDDSTVCIWDAMTGRELTILNGHASFVNSATFSPDSKRIVSASKDQTIRIWDTETGTELNVLSGHNSCVNSAAFSPDGKLIVSASDDNTIRIWEAKTGRELTILEGHTKSVRYAIFSPNGMNVISASFDNTIRIWEIETGKELTIIEFPGTILNAFFNSNGRTIVSASYDGTVRFWDFPPLQDLIDQTRERFKDRPLTPEERRMYYLE